MELHATRSFRQVSNPPCPTMHIGPLLYGPDKTCLLSILTHINKFLIAPPLRKAMLLELSNRFRFVWYLFSCPALVPACVLPIFWTMRKKLSTLHLEKQKKRKTKRKMMKNNNGNITENSNSNYSFGLLVTTVVSATRNLSTLICASSSLFLRANNLHAANHAPATVLFPHTGP